MVEIAREQAMNTEDKSRVDIKRTQEKLRKVRYNVAKIREKPTLEGSADAKRLIELTDEEALLERALRNEKDRQASDWN
jgi:hypothetical protein